MSESRIPEPVPLGDPRQIVRWARHYAKSRTISFLVQWIFIAFVVLIVAVAASLMNTAHRAGNTGLVTLSTMAMICGILVLTWFSVSSWGAEVVARVTTWLYGREGYVDYREEGAGAALGWWLTLLGGGLVVYHLIGALLITYGYVSLRYLQPFSAAYMVPYLVLLIVSQRLGFWAWFWPVLYALHALALLWNAPRFRGDLELLNVLLPVFGYGLIAILVGHIYSRFALHKLKRLARTGLEETVMDAPPESAE